MPENQSSGESGIAEAAEQWSAYYERTKQRPPRPLLVRALGYVNQIGTALDLGCGAGNDTRYLLERGFDVTAIDQQEAAIAGLADIMGDRLHAMRCRFSEFRFESDTFGLVNAQYALPFTEPGTFDPIFSQLMASLRSGGIFAGQFFGVRDGWNEPGTTLSLHTRESALEKLGGLEILVFDEIEEEGTLASGEPHHWHIFDIIARQPLISPSR